MPTRNLVLLLASCFASRSTVVLHVFRGLPGGLTIPIRRFHSKAFFAIVPSSLHKKWSIHFYTYLQIQISRDSSFEIVLVQIKFKYHSKWSIRAVQENHARKHAWKLLMVECIFNNFLGHLKLCPRIND